jgi:hypothetical protein
MMSLVAIAFTTFAFTSEEEWAAQHRKVTWLDA